MRSRSSRSESTLLPPSSPAKAHQAFGEIQGQMQVVAAQVATDKGLPSTDYRDVIRALKKEQLVGEAILTHYKARLKQIEEIIRDKQIVSLPAREARIRIATEGREHGDVRANMHPPRLLGNTGEVGEFVLPLNVADKAGKMQKFDDFNFEAASWTLTGAQGPGPATSSSLHRSSKQGVSDARITFAFNSTNVEGWGLYSEWLIEPFEPADGHLICLQHRRCAPRGRSSTASCRRARSPASKPWRRSRTTSCSPSRWPTRRLSATPSGSPARRTPISMATRAARARGEVEKAMGSRFNAEAFHDFILAQGLLPPHLMKKAVFEEFVGKPNRVGQLRDGRQ